MRADGGPAAGGGGHSGDPGGSGDIAVVGMAGRFPGARDLGEFWTNLRDGVESLSSLTDEQLRVAGVADDVIADPRLVRLRGVVEDPEMFDAAFFGYSPLEAATLDPQQRLFLECAWEAMERSGYDPLRFEGAAGVFAGGGPNTYLLAQVLPSRSHTRRVGEFAALLGSEKDLIAPRVSYKLNLRGPSVSVLTGCSTSLVATHLAVQSLLSGECDLALAGGATISYPRDVGLLHQEGGIGSPDGRCRAFDSAANGTAAGEAVAVVVLKRLADALADGDAVHGVIKGSAVNNDGADKIGFTAPSVRGQAEVVAEALAVAGVEAESIDYIEAHGTGTPLGDPVEIRALTEAFATDLRGFCRIGTVKPNIGHTDTAAGLAGLIKVLLSFAHETLPPSINCAQPSADIDFPGTPFVVNTRATPWPRGPRPRRAGVSSFSVGGTNAHIVVEEPPPPRPSSPQAGGQVLLLSAATPSALAEATTALAGHLAEPAAAGAGLADAAYTTQVGRAEFAYRRAAVAGTAAEAADVLLGRSPGLLSAGPVDAEPHVVFLFPGQGSQRPGMGREPYETDAAVRAAVDECAEILRPHLRFDLRDALYGTAGDTPAGKPADSLSAALTDTAVAQPALFVTGYAFGRRLLDLGVRPAAMAGHSVGELVAACLAGVFTLEDALALVAARGRLLAERPPGAMLAVALSEKDVGGLLAPGVEIAAVNGPGDVVVAGPYAAVEETRARLLGAGVTHTRLATSHAFHSALVEPAVPLFAAEAARVAASEPRVPLLSGVTGTWLTGEEAADPGYWGRQIREPVRFHDALTALARRFPGAVPVEVGPGEALRGIVSRSEGLDLAPVVPALAAAGGPALPRLLGELWLRGVPVDWPRLHDGARRNRVVLPTYPFQRRRHLVRPAPSELGRVFSPVPLGGTPGPGGDPAELMDLAELADLADLGEAAGEVADAAGERPELGTPYAPPRGPVEEELCAIWQELLGVERIGVHDDFYRLGGHSLLAVQIANRVCERFPVELSGAQVLTQAPTVAGFAVLIEELLTEKLAAMSDDEAAALLEKGEK
ncbi:Acyl transferase domain-containing protein [Sinosporangium album]|uniref:Acyl transferase domain-containing protein n=1 Tax=Sinosporangium album TaxID=504805 RepID=A0A1G8GNG3_9ACTN|nr:type I polyketide synthase [Sinosporangium album]SDH95909.1 Acyl transferase domain-containing protein [Sinosporangium album]